MLARAVHIAADEIDIVALDPTDERLVFVEVRSHTTSRFGMPEESVDRRKLRALYRSALALVRTGRLPGARVLPRRPWRVDLVAVDVRPALAPGVGGAVIRHIRGLSLE